MERRTPGAFNVCADDILSVRDLAGIIDHGRFAELPPRLLRVLLYAGHKANLVAADEGWLDMAVSVPMMANTKAKSELGWQPQRTAAEAVESLLRGMIDGRGAASVPLRPRNLDHARLPAASRLPGDTGPAHEGRTGAPHPQVSDTISRDLLALYLSDHLTGATAGAERIERMSSAYIDTPVYARLSELAEEIRRERSFLRRLIRGLGMRPRAYRQALSWCGERIGRLKSNGALLSRSPLTLVLETELMRSAVMGKLGGWQTLEDNADELNLDARVFADMTRGAQRQLAILDEIHEFARRRAFRVDRKTFETHSMVSP